MLRSAFAIGIKNPGAKIACSDAEVAPFQALTAHPAGDAAGDDQALHPEPDIEAPVVASAGGGSERVLENSRRRDAAHDRINRFGTG